MQRILVGLLSCVILGLTVISLSEVPRGIANEMPVGLPVLAPMSTRHDFVHCRMPWTRCLHRVDEFDCRPVPLKSRSRWLSDMMTSVWKALVRPRTSRISIAKGNRR